MPSMVNIMSAEEGDHRLCELKTQVAVLEEKVASRDKALKVADLGSHYLMSTLLAVAAVLISLWVVFRR